MTRPLRTVRTQISPIDLGLGNAKAPAGGSPMSAAEALRAAHAAGITVMFDGEDLVLEASAEPPQAVLDELARHKLSILALLRPGQGVGPLRTGEHASTNARGFWGMTVAC